MAVGEVSAVWTCVGNLGFWDGERCDRDPRAQTLHVWPVFWVSLDKAGYFLGGKRGIGRVGFS